MCCFSQPVELVSDTDIFARSVNGRQVLVYSMTYAARGDLAMVLPLPVPPNSIEEAVTFIDLQRYPDFFDDLRSGFPRRMVHTRSLGSKTLSLDTPKLRVHAVGDFEASFVPRIDDFKRLDERFRIPPDVWARLPVYHDYGFAVFKLKSSAPPWHGGELSEPSETPERRARKPRRVHPMAFEFPRRNPDLLYFPTVHVHDREVHSRAMFDHMLYCQPDTLTANYLQGWEHSPRPASKFMDIARAKDLLDPNLFCRRRPLEGILENKDTLVGQGGILPKHATTV